MPQPMLRMRSRVEGVADAKKLLFLQIEHREVGLVEWDVNATCC